MLSLHQEEVNPCQKRRGGGKCLMHRGWRHPTDLCHMGWAAEHRADLPDLVPAVLSSSLYPAIAQTVLNSSLPRNMLLTFGRAVGQRHLNYKQDSCKVSFPPLVQWGFFFPTPVLWCGLKVANAVRQERTALFFLLRDESIANHGQANPK